MSQMKMCLLNLEKAASLVKALKPALNSLVNLIQHYSQPVNQAQTPRGTENNDVATAKANIQLFIDKWENTHWKNSKRNDLTKDFQTLVLNNKAVHNGNSAWMHGNHGARKSRWGNKASSSEIKTLVELAQKYLEELNRR